MASTLWRSFPKGPGLDTLARSLNAPCPEAEGRTPPSPLLSLHDVLKSASEAQARWPILRATPPCGSLPGAKVPKAQAYGPAEARRRASGRAKSHFTCTLVGDAITTSGALSAHEVCKAKSGREHLTFDCPGLTCTQSIPVLGRLRRNAQRAKNKFEFLFARGREPGVWLQPAHGG